LKLNTRKNPRVEFIEIVQDGDLKTKERAVTEAVRRSYPNCGPIRLYRTTDGRIGFQISLSFAAGERKVLDDVYKTIMRALGERRGRRPGPKTVQAKLRLPEPVYSALKKAAEESNVTLSKLVADLARKELRNQAHL
jgi:hypothetical protein